MKKLLVMLIVASLFGAGGFYLWSRQPLIAEGAPAIEFTIRPGSGVRGATAQIAQAGVPVHPLLLELLARITGKAPRIKAGSYEIEGGTTPAQLIEQLARGQFAQHALVVIEGWTFAQMRAVVNANKLIRHDTLAWSDAEIMAKISADHRHPEGLFFPDTYLFAKGASDLQIYRQAHNLMLKRLNESWAARSKDLPYKSPYEALIMASIVEKETGMRSERNMIAAVFVNRLRQRMLLQTDPTVIYGLGAKFDGNLRKRDLLTDTPFNTYTRAGLPPTPISLPGAESLTAALHPADSDATYFVARGNGSSHFSNNLQDHNNAVNQFQRGGR